MRVRKISAALIGTALAATALAGCAPAPGSSSSFGCTPLSAGDGSVLSSVSVSGDFGKKPTIKTPPAFTIKHAERAEPIVGDGAQITETNQVASLELTLLNSATGEVLTQTDYSGKSSFVAVGAAASAITTFADSLMCARAGSRVVSAFPASDIDPQTAQGLGIGGGTGVVAIVDIVDVMKPHAEGSAVFNSGWGLPSVVRAPDGQPGVVIPTGAAPAKTVVQTLIRGDGAKLATGEQVVANVLGVSWQSKHVFTDTWSAGSPVGFANAESMPPAFADALKDATIGSQLLIVVPKSQITGTGQGAITYPTDEDLVFVVDVAGSIPAS